MPTTVRVGGRLALDHAAEIGARAAREGRKRRHDERERTALGVDPIIVR